jgi:hypothetical protein
MLSIKARRTVFAIIGFGILYFVFGLLNGIISNYSVGLQLSLLIIFVAVGIAIGLAWEKSTQAGYLAKVTSNPVSQARANTYRTVFIVGVIIGVIYLLYNIFGVYELSALGIGYASVDLFQLIPAIFFDVILAGVFLWLYREREQENIQSASVLKNIFLAFSIFYFVTAVLNVVTFIVARPNANTKILIQASGIATTTQNGTVIQQSIPLLITKSLPEQSITITAGLMINVQWSPKDFPTTEIGIVLRTPDMDTDPTTAPDAGISTQESPNNGFANFPTLPGEYGSGYLRLICVPTSACPYEDSGVITVVAATTTNP